MEKGLKKFLESIEYGNKNYCIAINTGVYISNVIRAVKEVFQENCTTGRTLSDPIKIAGGASIFIVDMDKQYSMGILRGRQFSAMYVMEQASRHDNVGTVASYVR